MQLAQNIFRRWSDFYVHVTSSFLFFSYTLIKLLNCVTFFGKEFFLVSTLAPLHCHQYRLCIAISRRLLCNGQTSPPERNSSLLSVQSSRIRATLSRNATFVRCASSTGITRSLSRNRRHKLFLATERNRPIHHTTYIILSSSPKDLRKEEKFEGSIRE